MSHHTRARQDDVEEMFRRHVVRAPGVADAALRDGLYAAQTEILRRLLHHVDQAMEDEGVAERTRDRVIKTVLYGIPDPAEADRRAAEQYERYSRVRAVEQSPELRKLMAEADDAWPPAKPPADTSWLTTEKRPSP